MTRLLALIETTLTRRRLSRAHQVHRPVNLTEFDPKNRTSPDPRAGSGKPGHQAKGSDHE